MSRHLPTLISNIFCFLLNSAFWQRALRKRRSTRPLLQAEKKQTVCVAHLVADHRFTAVLAKGDSSTAIDIMVQHIRISNNVYLDLDFDEDGKADWVGFHFT